MLQLRTKKTSQNKSVEEKHEICRFPFFLELPPFVLYFVLNTPLMGETVNPLPADRMCIGIFVSVTYMGKPILMYVKARNAASPRYFDISIISIAPVKIAEFLRYQ